MKNLAITWLALVVTVLVYMATKMDPGVLKDVGLFAAFCISCLLTVISIVIIVETK